MELLSLYEEVSGQKLNREKTALFFSKAVTEANRQIIKGILGVREIHHYEKYLGLPSLIGRGKKASFNYIKERVWRKLQGWEGKLLSQAGREVLIKAVIQAIPTYAMGCFKLPLGLCNEIEVMVRKFWWGQRGMKRKVHWIKWEEMTKAKMEGGMGFRDLALHNDSLLAKQAWRLLEDTNSLFYKVFKPRFFPNCTIMEAEESSRGSYAWKSILQGRDVIKRGACWRIGDGKKVKVWHHAWLPSKPPTRILSPILEGWEEATVDKLIKEDSRTWDDEVIDGLFAPVEANSIKSIPLSRFPTEDRLFWPWTQTGKYNCKSGYRFLKSEAEVSRAVEAQTEDRNFWRRIWDLGVHNKIKNFVWRACREAIPTKENLKRRHITENGRCERCLLEEETTLHALWSCSKIRSAWASSEWFGCQNVSPLNFKELLSWILKNHGNPELFVMVTWGLWHQRNQVRLNKACCPSDMIESQAKKKLEEFTATIPAKPAAIPRQTAKWRPPDARSFKINFDGAIFRQENRSGIGVAIRDHTGAVIASLAQSIAPAFLPIEIEAIAAARALEFGEEIGITEAVLEGDSEWIINSLKGGGNSVASVEPLLHDAKVFSSCYEKLLYSHCRRDGNRLAHSLARYSRNVSNYVVWMEGVPNPLFSVVQQDVANLASSF